MKTAPLRSPGLARPRRPRGAASLIVVMVLFFIISLVAAYTSRNLVFEQRTSGNQYRSTLAFEAADAGIEWAIARLNDARMNDDCTPLANAAAVNVGAPQPSFRERYLTIDPASGNITPVASRLAGCVFDGADWSCDCPAVAGDEPAPAFAANGAGPHVAFWLRFTQIPGRPGIVRVDVNSCTRLAPECLRFTRAAQSGDGLASLSMVLALRGGLATPPAAPLTVRGNTTAAVGAVVDVTNQDAASGGLTVMAGGPFGLVAPAAVLRTLPGTPAERSILADDASLQLPDLALVPATPANSGANRMFNSVFGMWPGTYSEQPGAVVVQCGAGCAVSDAGGVNDMLLLHPGHVIHVQGAGPLRIDTDVGTAAQPAVIVADGSVEFGGAPQTVHGVIYSRAALWTTANAGTVRGGIVAEHDLRVEGTQTLVYDPDVLRRLRLLTGSFVKVSGGWRDFAP